ncbi:MAG: ATP-binding cassette domain-containing protein, partial [Bacillota bacterium]|nr:ATP-binding cassette domain-containing protein [Bacillota bacterium]
FSTAEIRGRAAEMASFFGIQTWFNKNVSELSGGQKQVLNLASVMIMQPSVLILDEPTAQLDPVAAAEFIKILEKINRELGTTVIISEHRPEETFAISDRIIVMDKGRITAEGSPRKVCEILMKSDDEMCEALPVPAKIFGAVGEEGDFPVNIREGRKWLENYSLNHTLKPEVIPDADKFGGCCSGSETAVEIRNVWFRYEREQSDIIKGLSAVIRKGEIYAVMGGNGVGKTTALSLICGLNRPYRGEILINGKKLENIGNVFDGTVGMLPQNPQTLFAEKTVYLDLAEMLSDKKTDPEVLDDRINKVCRLCCIENLINCHPYDLSGGEQQRAALAKILLKNPEILILDEPTKGLDAGFKKIFADILRSLKEKGKTVIMVSHDIEFCAENADRTAMFFDGNIASEDVPRRFFAGKSFYTTAANRMAGAIIPGAVLTEDVINACGGRVKTRSIDEKSGVELRMNTEEDGLPESELRKPCRKILGRKRHGKERPGKAMKAAGCLFGAMFILTCVLQVMTGRNSGTFGLQMLTLAEAIVCLGCFFSSSAADEITVSRNTRGIKDGKRAVTAAAVVMAAVPATILLGLYVLDNRKYYFISIMIILETLIMFFMMFESRKPKAREIVTVSVLCGIAVAGRAAFFMIPQFKPAAALVIVSGICFGGETGFLVGAVTGFVSNFFFGQGPWTPWQMFALGIIGFASGIFYGKGLMKVTKLSLCVFGFAAVLILYGGIMNPASVIMWQDKPAAEMFVTAYMMGLPFDLVHAASTAFFLWVLSGPMIEKLERIKKKYGMKDMC